MTNKTMEIYFVSYARLDDDRGRLKKVSEELEKRVAARLGHKASALAFFDTTSIDTGEVWEQRIRDSVARVRLLICFCSNSFLNSEFCAREFDVVRRRLAQPNVPQGTRAVIPVLWDKCELPQALLTFQLTSGKAPTTYLSDGILALHRLKSQRASYEKTLAMLTDAIETALRRKPLPPWKEPVGFDELAVAFDNPGDDNVHVVALHPDGMRWALAPGNTLRRSIERVTSTLRKRWRAIRPSAQLGKEIDAATQRGNLTVVVVHGDYLNASPWKNYLKLSGGQRSSVRVLLGVDSSTKASEAADASFDVDDSEDFERKLTEAITEFEMAALSTKAPSRVESSELRKAAAAQGITLDSKPQLSSSNEAS